jgi:hypothetical protein
MDPKPIPSPDLRRQTSKRVSTSRTLTERLPLSAPETEVISAFIHFGRITGIPRSVAEIFGLLFVSPSPVSNDEVLDRLNLSAGAASQGLRQLKEVGAIRTVYVSGDRRDHYVVETGSGVVAAFLRNQVRQYHANGASRLERLTALVYADETKTFSGIDFLRERIRLLSQWHMGIARLCASMSDEKPAQEPSPKAPPNVPVGRFAVRKRCGSKTSQAADTCAAI